MNKRILVFAMLAATAFFCLPANTEAASPYAASNTSAGTAKGELKAQQRRGDRGFNRGHRKQYPRRYRNYGQYRRTQVGNRRFRFIRHNRLRNGVRTMRRGRNR